MMLRFAFFAALLTVALPAYAAPPRKAAPVAARPDTAPRIAVALVTGQGRIVIELDREHAPITTANFLRYVDQKRLDGTVFYRAMKLKWGEGDNGLIQAGTRGDPKRTLKPIAHEPTTQTGLLHKAGAISMARFAPGTAAGDFSILLSDLPSLDADPKASGDNAGYAVFGHVTDGMDVVKKIFDLPTSPTAGEGVLKGQMLAAPVKIVTARREPIVKPASQ